MISVASFWRIGIIAWHQAILMAVGGSLDGYLSAHHYARQLEPHLIRKFVMIVAFTMTAYFFIHG